MKTITKHKDCSLCDTRFSSVFNCVNNDNMKSVNSSKTCSIIKKGQLIFSEQNTPHGLYCVNSGKIKIFQTGEGGKEQIIRMAKGGDIMGYRALIGGDKYSCSAMAIDDSNVCFIPRETFFQLIQKDTNLAMELLKLLSHDLRYAEHRITDLAQKPVKERIAEALLFLKETYGLESDGETINIIMTREELANLAGTVSETCIRTLSELKNENIIEAIGKKIRILSMQKLIKAANILD